MNKVFCILFFTLSLEICVYFTFTSCANSEEPHLKFLVAFHGQCGLYGITGSLCRRLRTSLLSLIKMFTLDSQEKLDMHPESTQ